MSQNFNGDWRQRVVFADSHDTAANGGARMVAVATHDTHGVSARRISILSSAIALTAPGIPMLLAGSEFLQGGDFNDWNALDWDNTQKFSGIVQAHHDLIALRANKYGDTAGLQSSYVKVLMQDENCRVLVYQRGEDANQPVVVVVNFSGVKWNDYRLCLPGGAWRVRFNSSWKGYSSDFMGVEIDKINASQVITLPPHGVLLLTRD